MNLKELAKKHGVKLRITKHSIILDELFKIMKIDTEFYLIDNYLDTVISSTNIEDCLKHYIKVYI